jgi:hypothetical protein
MAKKKNPRGTTGKFERCVEAVSARGGAYDPRAVCAAQERREIGQRELTRRAVEGKRRAARGNAASYRGRSVRELEQMRVYAQARAYDNDWMVRQQGREDVKDIDKALANARRREAKQARGNPADTAAEAYERFHGEPPSRFTEVTERIHYHANLWSVGTLTYLIVRTIDKTAEVKLKKFAGAFLAANEQAWEDLARTGHARAQLFIKGGDQSIQLEDFGIDSRRAHEVETLGRIVGVGYETTKVHLGSEGGHAVYDHKFKTTREGDAEVKVDWARYPDLIYRVLDEHLEFSGGSYELIAEGINL